MAERPDLEYVVPILGRELAGVAIASVRVKKPVVLRVAVRGKIEELLPGRRFGTIERRAHMVVFELAGTPPLEMVIAPMLAGRFALAAATDKAPGDLAVTFVLAGDRELRYRDDVQMGKVYLIPAGARAAVPGLARIGVDVLDPNAFTREAFRELAATRRDQAKVFLMDKSALDAFGNAYADEALWEAGIHPKTWVKSLSAADLDRLHQAMVKVIGEATRIIQERRPPLDEKLRDFLKVRGRHGDPCPSCGTTIRAAGVHGHDAFFCPRCQPATRPSGIVDWRGLGLGNRPAHDAPSQAGVAAEAGHRAAAQPGMARQGQQAAGDLGIVAKLAGKDRLVGKQGPARRAGGQGVRKQAAQPERAGKRDREPLAADGGDVAGGVPDQNQPVGDARRRRASQRSRTPRR